VGFELEATEWTDLYATTLQVSSAPVKLTTMTRVHL